MTDLDKSLVLAIDGGGTRCRIAIANGAKHHIVEAGSANVSTDFDAAISCLQGGLQKLAIECDLPVQAISALPAFVGLAGVTGPEIVSQLDSALPFSNAQYADDRHSALRGALGKDDGVVAHCGTGSFFAAQTEGNVRLSGGWGSVLGDEASAQWVGRMALNVTLQHVDGFLPSSEITKSILSQFKGAPGIVAFAGTATPAEFGSLAPMVTSLAESGDQNAVQVMRNAAVILALNLEQIGFQRGMALCLTGGIGPHYAPYLPSVMQHAIQSPKASPLEGAIDLARDRLKET
ncbi:BadF/BadG/BcrA/BcrD ATPase family protein [Shimia sp.]|uniref:BadF/BadG/BcrA/BcrD ATPase family protein n=1 Tax=Shimia sp. TaxID=1954381 RepID=UPI003296D240